MSITKYPTYKATGLEWLESIPSHWEVKRLKLFCVVFPSNVDKKSVEGETPVRLCNYTDVYYNDFIGENTEFMTATATEEQIAKFSLKGGDTIITKDSETADDIAIAAYVPKDLPGVICGYHLSMVRPREGVKGAFVKRLFDSTYAKSLMAVRANGLTRVGLSQYAIDNVELPLPPEEEQSSIVDFLDRETAKIDALIAEQERLIELLQEKRQAVISHAVTKGLNPDAPMKASGVEWLGEVPAHWVVTRLGFLCSKIGSGKTPLGGAEAYRSDGILFIRSQNVYDEGLCLEDAAFISEETDAEQSWSRVLPGDLLLNITGASLGRTCLVPDDFRSANVNQHVCIIRLRSAAHRGFASMMLKSAMAKSQFDAVQNGAAREGINFSQISKLQLVMPPEEEQVKITEFLECETARFDVLVSTQKHMIELLEERRSSLISAAVTGQIDVRGLVPAGDAT